LLTSPLAAAGEACLHEVGGESKHSQKYNSSCPDFVTSAAGLLRSKKYASQA